MRVWERGKYSLSVVIRLFIYYNLFAYKLITSSVILVDMSDSISRAARRFAVASGLVDESKQANTTLSVATGYSTEQIYDWKTSATAIFTVGMVMYQVVVARQAKFRVGNLILYEDVSQELARNMST